MQGADVAPTARELVACDKARKEAREVVERWTALRTTGLAALNAKLRTAGQASVAIPGVPCGPVRPPDRTCRRMTTTMTMMAEPEYSRTAVILVTID